MQCREHSGENTNLKNQKHFKHIAKIAIIFKEANKMVEKLLIYTDDEELGVISFPKDGTQAALSSYTFTEGRMGSVNINSSLMYSKCLDDEWTQREFVEFRGERYWILDTPTSSKSNTDLRYKHELVFKSDRTKLDNTYFFDVVSPDAGDVDQFVSNSTKFTFFGDIAEFATRLNYSLQYSGVDYSVVIDEGISSEAKLMSFEDKYFSEVLQEVFNVYELPYYFVGKVIHIGFTNNALTRVFKYGHDRELLTISKTNANYKTVNRCTGIGSTENIPYYYPNDTRKGAVEAIAGEDNISIKTEDIQVVNNDLYKEKVSLEEKVEFKKTKLPITTQLYINLNEQYPYTQAVETVPTIRDGSTNNFKWFETSYDYYAIIDLSDEATISLTINLWAKLFYKYIQKHNMLAGMKQAERKMDFASYSLYKRNESDTDWVLIKADQQPGETISFNLIKGTNKLKIGAKYSTLVNVSDYVEYLSEKALLEISRESTAEYNLWSYKDNTVSLSNIGIYITKTPSIGDYFIQKQVEGDYMITSPNLLPPIYRETMGAERFYNAQNNTYISPDTGEYYDFENEYTEGNPKEMIVSFDYIKPTIKGIKNAAGQAIGEILDVAFDDDDNDEIDPNTNEYEHKFFYIKLRKFDGEYGFNIFDQAIVGNDMTISVTSGNCAACNFVISVLEIKDDDNNTVIFKNPVQVDSNGDIVPGGWRDKWNEANIQPQQQDTRTNNVWIRVAKDQDTFGTVMPSNNRNYKPKAGDSFVILHIDLPIAYIRNAENELKEAIIKYMAANNSEKFNFSINFKRIFFAEYPEMLSQIDANARLQIEYNDKLYELYVSQYTYKVNGTDPLPEITVELADTITIRKGNVQKSIDAVKQDIMSSIGSIDFLKMGLKYFIRKDVDDSANGHLVFKNGLYVTNEGKGVAALQEGDTNAIQEGDTNAIQEYTESLEEPVIPTSMTLGELENVNSIVDTPSVEDVVLVKKAGTGTWIQEKKNISSSEKVYVTTLNIGKIESDLPDVTQEDKDEVFNIIQKYKDGYVVIYAQDEVSVNDTVTRYTPLNVVLSEDETQVWITYHSKNGIRHTLTTTPILEVGATWDYQKEIIEAPIDGKTYGRRNRTWIEINQSGGSTDIKYISVDYVTFNELVGNSSTTSSDIINVIGQSNLDRMFSEDGCPIEFANVMTQGVSAFTKCVLKGNIGGVSIVAIPIETLNIGYNIMLQNGTYSIEKNTYITFDSVLDGDSMNAPQTRTVYNELQNKAGIYKTSLKLGDIQARYDSGDKVVTTAQLNELQNIKSAWINNKVVIINDNSGYEFYYGILQYTTYDDSSNISVAVMDSRGVPRCFTFDGTAITPEWEIHGVETEINLDGNTNSNVKILTTPGLFNLERESGNEITLNQNDINIIKSLFSNGYKTTQLYYCGEVNYDYGLFPLNVGSQFEKPYADAANDIETIYLNLTTAIGILIFESLSIGDVNDIYTVGSPVQPVTNYIAAQSIANLNGYVKFTSGLMIQYGYSTTSHKDSKISLPISFIDEKYNITFTPKYLSSYGNESMVDIYINTYDKTGFNVIGRMFNETGGITDVTNAPFNWIAIGRWK